MSSWFKSWANIPVNKIFIHYSEDLRPKFDAVYTTWISAGSVTAMTWQPKKIWKTNASLKRKANTVVKVKVSTSCPVLCWMNARKNTLSRIY